MNSSHHTPQIMAIILSMALGLAPAWGDTTHPIRSLVEQDYSYLAPLYQHLHQHPELSKQEAQTAQRIAKELSNLNFDVTTDFAGHGVVGLFKNGNGPTLLIRTDLDALPIQEQTGLPYASQNPGVMHACGHDVHMSVMVGTARQLVALKQHWRGTLIMIGQPAEELGLGAKAMLQQGLFTEFPRPDYNLALHVSSDLPAGSLGLVPGYAFANVDSVDIIVKGQGGHGAYPEKTKDPVVLAAQIVLALQTIVSREISPLDPAVITVGSIQGGSKHNIIPDQVTLQLTLRSYSSAVRAQVIAAIRRISTNLGIAYGLEADQLPEVNLLDEFTPSTYNHPDLSQRVLALFQTSFGAERAIEMAPEMIGEDFGRYGQEAPQIPSLMFRLGTVAKADYKAHKAGTKQIPSLHSAYFAPDPQATITTGVEAMTQAALMLLHKHNKP